MGASPLEGEHRGGVKGADRSWEAMFKVKVKEEVMEFDVAGV